MDKLYQLIILLLICFNAFAEEAWTTVEPSYRTITIIGYSRARHQMVLSSEVDGKVKKVFVDVGDTVSKNRKTVCLDDTFVKIDINSAKNEMAQHQVDINYYKKQVERYKDLVGKKSVAISQLDDFQRQLGNSERMKQSKFLEKKRLQEKQARHCIKSPSGWMVIERNVEAGQWIDIGSQVLTVGDYSKLLVPLALSVNELKVLKSDPDNIKVWLSEYKKDIPATIERISPAFDEKSRKILVDLQLERELPIHQGGLKVELKLKIPDPEGTFLISEKALDKRFEEVWVNPKGGEPLRVELLGHVDDGKVRITSPLIKNGNQFKIITTVNREN